MKLSGNELQLVIMSAKRKEVTGKEQLCLVSSVCYRKKDEKKEKYRDCDVCHKQKFRMVPPSILNLFVIPLLKHLSKRADDPVTKVYNKSYSLP